jgi:hypothetical protein
MNTPDITIQHSRGKVTRDRIFYIPELNISIVIPKEVRPFDAAHACYATCKTILEMSGAGGLGLTDLAMKALESSTLEITESTKPN